MFGSDLHHLGVREGRMIKDKNEIINHINFLFLKHKGLTNKKIADMLKISITTVDNHLAYYEKICKKSGVF